MNSDYLLWKAGYQAKHQRKDPCSGDDTFLPDDQYHKYAQVDLAKRFAIFPLMLKSSLATIKLRLIVTIRVTTMMTVIS